MGEEFIPLVPDLPADLAAVWGYDRIYGLALVNLAASDGLRGGDDQPVHRQHRAGHRRATAQQRLAWACAWPSSPWPSAITIHLPASATARRSEGRPVKASLVADDAFDVEARPGRDPTSSPVASSRPSSLVTSAICFGLGDGGGAVNGAGGWPRWRGGFLLMGFARHGHHRAL